MKKLANLFRKRDRRKVVDTLSDAVLDAAIDAMRNEGGPRSAILYPSTRGISVSYDTDEGGQEKWYLFVEDGIYMSIRGELSSAVDVMTMAILEYLGQ